MSADALRKKHTPAGRVLLTTAQQKTPRDSPGVFYQPSEVDCIGFISLWRWRDHVIELTGIASPEISGFESNEADGDNTNGRDQSQHNGVFDRGSPALVIEERRNPRHGFALLNS